MRSASAMKGQGHIILKETIYKVCITTGGHKSHGTSARVYLRMKGSKGKMQKKCLSKCKKPAKSKSDSKKTKTKPFKFLPGGTQVFKIKHEDIGSIKSITLEVKLFTNLPGSCFSLRSRGYYMLLCILYGCQNTAC